MVCSLENGESSSVLGLHSWESHFGLGPTYNNHQDRMFEYWGGVTPPTPPLICASAPLISIGYHMRGEVILGLSREGRYYNRSSKRSERGTIMISPREWYLRNIKHFPCWYTVIWTRVEIGKTRNCVDSNFHECWYNYISEMKWLTNIASTFWAIRVWI